MSNYIWDRLLEEERGPFTVIVDKTWEDLNPKDCFDTSIDPDTGKPYYDVHQMCQDIDNDLLDWFMLRARVMFAGVELGNSVVGGFLYKDAREVLTDGTAEDLIYEAMEEAVGQAHILADKFAQLELDLVAV